MSADDRCSRGSPCPSREDLVAFREGNQPAEQREAISEHLRRCPPCRESFDAIVPDDTPYVNTDDYQRGATRVPPPASEVPPPLPLPIVPALLREALGQYEIIAELGRGGMGTVYKARHARLKRMVALKVLSPDRVKNADAVTRFEREIEAAGRIEHRNIVRATDAGEVDGIHFLVMELVEGVNLSDLVRARGALAAADACEIARRAAVGLQQIHGRQMVHRDVKPSNLMLTLDGEVKILDLGLALLYGDRAADDELTTDGQVLGTYDYMAPEQWNDARAVDGRADLYSLGCTLYKLLTGKVPFSNSAAHYHAQGNPGAGIGRRIPDRGNLPADLYAVVARMLAAEPGDRFRTAAEVVLALEPFAGGDLTGLVGAVPHESARSRTPPAPADEAVRPSRASTLSIDPAPPSAIRRSRAALLVAVGTVVGFVGVGAWLLLGNRPDGPDHKPLPVSPARPPPRVPGVSYGLLDREPAVLRWPSPPLNSHKTFRAEQKELVLTCQDLGMLALGQTAEQRYRLGITMHQNPWAGNIGLFFGHQDCQVGAEAGQRYHVLELTPSPDLGPPRRFQILWTLRHHLGPPGGQRDISLTCQVSDPFILPARAQRLDLAVGPKGLEVVSWEGQVLARLGTAHVAPAPSPATFRGTFGVYVSSGNGVFRDAKYSFQKGP